MIPITVFTGMSPSTLSNGEKVDAELDVRIAYPQYRWRFLLRTDNMPNDFTLAYSVVSDEDYVLISDNPDFPIVS